jgi:hypothetical protein
MKDNQYSDEEEIVERLQPRALKYGFALTKIAADRGMSVEPWFSSPHSTMLNGGEGGIIPAEAGL